MGALLDKIERRYPNRWKRTSVSNQIQVKKSNSGDSLLAHSVLTTACTTHRQRHAKGYVWLETVRAGRTCAFYGQRNQEQKIQPVQPLPLQQLQWPEIQRPDPRWQ